MFNNRVVIPPSLQLDMLNTIYDGHLGVTKCRGRASYSICCPLITKQINAMVNRRHICAKLWSKTRDLLLALSSPAKPWNCLASDLFELGKKLYVIAVDYSSRWLEVRKLPAITSGAVTRALCEIFAIYGTPDLSKIEGFTHVSSSPIYPQANAEV